MDNCNVLYYNNNNHDHSTVIIVARIYQDTVKVAVLHTLQVLSMSGVCHNLFAIFSVQLATTSTSTIISPSPSTTGAGAVSTTARMTTSFVSMTATSFGSTDRQTDFPITSTSISTIISPSLSTTVAGENYIHTQTTTRTTAGFVPTTTMFLESADKQTSFPAAAVGAGVGVGVGVLVAIAVLAVLIIVAVVVLRSRRRKTYGFYNNHVLSMNNPIYDGKDDYDLLYTVLYYKGTQMRQFQIQCDDQKLFLYCTCI